MHASRLAAYMARSANRCPGARVTPPPSISVSKLRGSSANAQGYYGGEVPQEGELRAERPVRSRDPW
jgi:hypothetical protein